MTTAIRFTSFFPGGLGLWLRDQESALPPWPRHGVMILGHDFHSREQYELSLARGCEDQSQPTWRALKGLLAAASIDPAMCFFTNFFMGVRDGRGTTGRFPGSRDARFVAICTEFLVAQLDAQQPRLVLTLGSWVPRYLAPLTPALSHWRRQTTLKALDVAGPLVRDATLHTGGSTVVAALSHPSFYPRSMQHRSYRGRTGRFAHALLVSDAVHAAESAA